jgi:DNA ligase (NAD+)
MDVVNDKIVKAYTRGQDGVGLDLTSLFDGRISGRSTGLKKFTLKGECVMTWDDFEKYCAECGESYANPRTAVSGLFSAKDSPRWVKYLTIVGLDFSIDGDEQEDRTTRLIILNNIVNATQGCNSWSIRLLENWEFKFSKNLNIYWTDDIEINEDNPVLSIADFYKHIIEIRNNLDVMADGIVFELLDSDDREQLGTIKHDGKTLPKWAIATKFPHKSAATILEAVEWDVANSLSGRVTPCAIIRPIVIDGKEYRRVSLSNINRLRNEQFKIGGRVVLTIRGDVLGYVAPDPSEFEASLPRVSPAKYCPVCGAKLKLSESGAWLFCPDAECGAKLPGKICNYLAKMRIKGIEESIVNRLVDAELLTNIRDLYTLDSKRIAVLPGFGTKSAAKIQSALALRTTVADWEMLGSWNWTGLGRTMMHKLMDRMTWTEVFHIFNTYEKSNFVKLISTIDGFSAISAINLHNGIFHDHVELNAVIGNFINITQTKNDDPQRQEVKSLIFVITGPLRGFERDNVKTLLMQKGHKLVGGISKKTDYLVTNTPDSGTVKNKEAIALNVPIINEEQFVKISGIIS